MLLKSLQQVPTSGDVVDKKLSYIAEGPRDAVVSVEILPVAMQQRRNYSLITLIFEFLFSVLYDILCVLYFLLCMILLYVRPYCLAACWRNKGQ